MSTNSSKQEEGRDVTAVSESLQSVEEALCCLLIITQLTEGKRQVTETPSLVATVTQRSYTPQRNEHRNTHFILYSIECIITCSGSGIYQVSHSRR